MSENLFILGMLGLWLLLMAILGRALYQYIRRKKWPEAIVFGAIILTLLMLTGGWALFFVFVLGCSVGLDLPCLL